MHLDRDLTTGLGIAEDSTEDEASAAIVAFISSANQDDTHERKLSHLYHLVTKTGSARLLDALNTLPLLVPSRDPGAGDILSLIGECCSAKEVVMSVQEIIERLGSATDPEDDDEVVAPSPSSQLVTCVELYTTSIPRLKLRRKTAAETLKPLFSDLETAIDSNGKQATRDEGRILITSCSQLVAKLISWVADVERDSKDCNLIFKNLIDNVLTTFSHCICSSLAQRDFEAFFPQLTIHTAVNGDWKEGEDAVGEAIKAYSLLGISTTSLSSLPSTSSLILLSHSEIGERLSSELLHQLLPALLASLQSNTALDESLSILLRILNRLHSQPRVELSPEVIVPLCTTLPPLANHHPDPLVRHQIFRVISSLLALSPTQLQLDILTGLTTNADLPNICVAAVGLVKEAILQALSPSAPKPNIFSTPLFFKIFGPILFRPNPPDLFNRNPSLDDFLESSEPARLTECLALYYVLLKRDESNSTGVRDRDVIATVEKNLLFPLQRQLEEWAPASDAHAKMALVSLGINLERALGAVAEMRGTTAV